MGPSRSHRFAAFRVVALAVFAALAAAVAVGRHLEADELSTADELRALYSDRFSFTDQGLPLLTVEIMSGQRSITLMADRVLPGGQHGPEVRGASRWTVTVEDPKPATIREWVVVEHLDHDDDAGVAASLARWRARGYQPQRFEIGTVFGVGGEVIDSRELLVGIAPVDAGKGAAEARRIAQRHGVETAVYPELVRAPSGLLIAESGDARITVRNRSVLWFGMRDARKTIRVDDVVYGGGGSQLRAERREDRAYWGMVYVTLDRAGQLVAVNAVSADKLLEGLVPAEIFPVAHPEALAAQAIAARTELLSRIGTRHIADPYLLCSNQHCQVYGGAGKETPQTSAAVHRTRGTVLLREGGGLVDARYSSSCGGHSENNEYIWGGAADPSLRGQLDGTRLMRSRSQRFDTVTDENIEAFLASSPTDAFCGGTRFSENRFRWRIETSAADLSSRIATVYPDVGRVVALVPLERGTSGRIRSLRIVGRAGSAVAQGDLHIRKLLGGLRSTLFAVRAVGPRDAPERFVFNGAGFGHGVGMCQTGAIGRAEAGMPVDQILEHYYPGSHPHRLY